jgi:hypothetical protein
MPGTETVNDRDAYLVNLWRAIQADPDETAYWADWPVSEADVLARHRWLLNTGAERLQTLRTDPEYFDAKVAGWWVWGQCAWIGSGWCREPQQEHLSEQLPHLGSAGQGINRRLPHLGDAGRGINRKLPHLGNAGQGIPRIRAARQKTRQGHRIREYFSRLSERLRHVRICQGEWDRVLGDSVTVKHGLTAIFLDPPYTAHEHSIRYSADSDVSPEVQNWAITNGNNPELRIALCGYEGEHQMPDSWECIAWKAPGGYGSQAECRGRDNAHRERIWFSPHCLRPQESLFAEFYAEQTKEKGLFEGKI